MANQSAQVWKERAIQKATSMKTFLMSPRYDDLKNLHDQYVSASPGDKVALMKDMRDILVDYGFKDERKPGKIALDQIDWIITHLFLDPDAGGASRAW
jgi:hypothetical protein